MNRSYLAFMKDHETLQTSSDRYSLVQNRKTKQQFLLQSSRPANIPLLKLKSRTLDQHLNIEHEYILPLCRYFVSETGQPTLTAIYKTGLHTLAEEVEARADERKHFKENQIWAVLYGIVQGMSHIQSMGLQCGSLSMELIYLTETGKAKIIDPSFIEGISQLSRGRYYSPQEVTLLTNPNIESDVYKSNVFVTALCILHCCLLADVYDYIDLSIGTIDFNYLEQLLEEVSQIYSEDLVRLLVDMLDEELTTRPSFIELEEHMKKICTREQQEINTLPVPIDSQNLRDEKVSIDFPDQMSVPDIGEGGPQESYEPKFPKLANPLQMSLSNGSSIDTNNMKAFGLDQIKNIKIADSLSYSGAQIEPYHSIEASFVMKESLNMIQPTVQTQTRLQNQMNRSREKHLQASALIPNSKIQSEFPLPSYSYQGTSVYSPLISNTDSSGLFTSPQLLSFLKMDLHPIATNENLNPN